MSPRSSAACTRGGGVGGRQARLAAPAPRGVRHRRRPFQRPRRPPAALFCERRACGSAANCAVVLLCCVPKPGKPSGGCGAPARWAPHTRPAQPASHAAVDRQLLSAAAAHRRGRCAAQVLLLFFYNIASYTTGPASAAACVQNTEISTRVSARWRVGARGRCVVPFVPGKTACTAFHLAYMQLFGCREPCMLFCACCACLRVAMPQCLGLGSRDTCCALHACPCNNCILK